jgi:para-aminobenzoate synthetase component 1
MTLKRINLSKFPSTLLMEMAGKFAHLPGTCLLYSGGCGDSAERSLLALFPYETIIVFGSEICHRMGKTTASMCVDDSWDALQTCFFSRIEEDPGEMAFGWFGYGMAASADKEKALPYRPSVTADAFWQRCALVVIVDHRTEEAEVKISMNQAVMDVVGGDALKWLEMFSTAEGWQEYLQQLKLHPCNHRAFTTSKEHIFHTGGHRRSRYLEDVQQAKQLISEGEIYQVNLSQEFIFDALEDPFSLFHQINQLNPAPFSTFFNSGDTTIVCSSPERFLCKRGTRLETRPIKGTIPRGRNGDEDAENREKLLTSTKERAELLMITDLMRNDLGKVSETGSVVVPDLYRCEAYTNVFHLLSIIQSEADGRHSSLDIIRSSFPGGSITGCPKLRAIEVIDALELRPRGIYTGSIGYIVGNGDFDLNITIRSLVMQKGGSSSIQLGSGILFDSNAEDEYRETLHKGSSLFDLLGLREALQREIDGII